MANRVSSTEFQRNIGAYLKRVAWDHEMVIVVVHGREMAAMIPMGGFRALEALGRLADPMHETVDDGLVDPLHVTAPERYTAKGQPTRHRVSQQEKLEVIVDVRCVGEGGGDRVAADQQREEEAGTEADDGGSVLQGSV